jgi:hypothetical protein
LATVDIYVDKDAGGAANGNDWTNAYTELETGIVARAEDLTSSNDIHHYHVRASGSTAMTSSVASLDSYTTDVDDYVIIEWEDDHQGKKDTSLARIDSTTSFTNAINIETDYTRLIGAQCSHADNSGGVFLNADNCLVDKLIMYGCTTIGLDDGNSSNYVRNSLIYGAGGDGYYHDAGNNQVLANCIVVSSGGVGIHADGFVTTTAINCYSGNNTGADYSEEATATLTLTTCYSEDGTESTTTAAYSTSAGCYFTNITGGSEDYHTTSSSTLIGNGTDQSGTFTDDIDGDTRSAWDIGADEFIVVGGNAPTGHLEGPFFGPFGGPI